MAFQLRVYVPEHPLIKPWFGVARDANTPSILFKTAMTELGRWLTEETLDVNFYLNKLSQQFHPETRIILLEPMLATGRSITVAINEITKRGANPELIRIISVVAAPPALQKLS